MINKVFITNGTGGCGKDTFAKLLGEFVSVEKYSSIDFVKKIAQQCGWHGGKTEKDRKFLSDLKLAMSEYNDMPFRTVKCFVEHCGDPHSVILIDIREPEEIEKAKQAFDAKTILIVRKDHEPITSNMADANVNNYKYDFVIHNDGTPDGFRETVKAFAEYILD